MTRFRKAGKRLRTDADESIAAARSSDSWPAAKERWATEDAIQWQGHEARIALYRRLQRAIATGSSDEIDAAVAELGILATEPDNCRSR